MFINLNKRLLVYYIICCVINLINPNIDYYLEMTYPLLLLFDSYSDYLVCY